MMADKHNDNKPTASRTVRVVPVSLQKADIEKLARTLISIAKKLAEQEKAKSRKGDAMT